MPRIRETNNIISAYLRTLANSEYIDIFTPMIGPDDRPRGDLFLPDRLHMNEAGYRLWQSVISAHVAAPAVLADTATPGALAVPTVALRPKP